MKSAGTPPSAKGTGRPLLAAGGLLLSLTLLGLVFVFGLSKAQTTDQANEKCIRCHVEQFEKGLRQTYAHLPFYERRCTSCHLAGSPENTRGIEAVTTDFTGAVVSQEDQWQKRRIYRGESRVFDQFFNLDPLVAGTDYRFRISIGEEPDAALATTRWMLLDPAELKPVEVPQDILLPTDSALIDLIRSLQMTLLSSGTVLLSWETNQPLYGWVELEAVYDPVAGVAIEPLVQNDIDTVSDQHPSLRSPEDLAIEACYDCHSISELGTSHPVRLYSGRNVKIPEELPTVDGMLTCVTCHDPHGSEGKMLVRTVIKTKLCVTCHVNFKNSSPSTMFN